MILTKEELDDLRKLNPPDDPRMFWRFLDTIDALESQLAQVQADVAAAVEAALRKAAELCHYMPSLHYAILALIPGNALAEHDARLLEPMEKLVSKLLALAKLWRLVGEDRRQKATFELCAQDIENLCRATVPALSDNSAVLPIDTSGGAAQPEGSK